MEIQAKQMGKTERALANSILSIFVREMLFSEIDKWQKAKAVGLTGIAEHAEETIEWLYNKLLKRAGDDQEMLQHIHETFDELIPEILNKPKPKPLDLPMRAYI